MQRIARQPSLGERKENLSEIDHIYIIVLGDRGGMPGSQNLDTFSRPGAVNLSVATGSDIMGIANVRWKNQGMEDGYASLWNLLDAALAPCPAQRIGS